MEPSLPAPVEEAAAAAAGGKLYVMGGFNAAGESLSTVYVFDGATWSAGPRLPLAVDHPSAATLDDRVYIAGGHSNGRDSVRVFRLDGDSWTEVAPLHYARGGHALVSVAGRLYAIGGNTASGNVGPTESYNPATNGWSVLADLPAPRNHVAGFSVDDVACVAGGRSPNTARVDCLLLVTGVWSRTVPSLPAPASGGGALGFPNGDVVAAGGEDATEVRMIDQLVYRTGGGWTSPAKMLSPRHGFQLALFGARAWACGGGSAPGLHPVATCTSLGDLAAP
jgi:Kelch motif